MNLIPQILLTKKHSLPKIPLKQKKIRRNPIKTYEIPWNAISQIQFFQVFPSPRRHAPPRETQRARETPPTPSACSARTSPAPRSAPRSGAAQRRPGSWFYGQYRDVYINVCRYIYICTIFIIWIYVCIHDIDDIDWYIYIYIHIDYRYI
jgi:hypothetical protein